MDFAEAMKPHGTKVQLLHLVRDINDEYAVCGVMPNWATTSPKTVTCPQCKRIAAQAV